MQPLHGGDTSHAGPVQLRHQRAVALDGRHRVQRWWQFQGRCNLLLELVKRRYGPIKWAVGHRPGAIAVHGEAVQARRLGIPSQLALCSITRRLTGKPLHRRARRTVLRSMPSCRALARIDTP
jgi:hypothetical protein